MPLRPAVAHVRMNGATTSTPQASPSVQVRNTSPELVSRDHVAQPQRQRPERGTDHRRDQRAGEQGEHVGDPIQPAAPTREAAQEQRGGHERDGVPERLGEHRPQRRRVVAEKQIADHDRGPQADAVEEQHGEAEAGRRPQRRHRAVEVGQLEADATGAVVGERHEREREHIEHRPGAFRRRRASIRSPTALRPGAVPLARRAITASPLIHRFSEQRVTVVA